ncbi:hypothetical protein KL933_004142 [Ogataea haglerorum]|uniref:Uncharacterized protein n=1 Tax=Ogataea haglerorum TaxID=1937702 RepID=A0AAN6D2W0_9ASCO|nr:uncharacterized protein KL911_004173 [Ogataea haglerorum]KAG7715876.1 hypothetical protein KL913_003689 [Ogataea haglerorum]KAG7716559.1 hypothetical protein KL949_003850 [Ogataea haglerorum]KAG7725576.1 hypothetical protein KL933_004142 [Ogataea haglerorum]KAG7736815.1 hypothetical protein KL923_004398 [Ogataea haglerorum]KAG7746557.1 hypothetical protein KL912_004134 [Ogataea haglerorum]
MSVFFMIIASQSDLSTIAIQKLVKGHHEEQFAGAGDEIRVVGEQFCETGSEERHPAEIEETEEAGRKQRHSNGNLVVFGLGADDVGQPCRAADPDRERDLKAERRDGRDDRLRGQLQRVELRREKRDHLERKRLRQDHKHAGKAQGEEWGPFGGELAESGIIVPALVAVDEADVKTQRTGDEPVGQHKCKRRRQKPDFGNQQMVQCDADGHSEEYYSGGGPKLVLRLEVSFGTLKRHNGRNGKRHYTEILCTQAGQVFVSSDHIDHRSGI